MKYYVEEHSGPEDAFDYPKNLDDRWDRYTAQDLAQDYHNEHDGWESSWPLTFVLLDDDGTKKARYSIEREVEPVFYAAAIPPSGSTSGQGQK